MVKIRLKRMGAKRRPSYRIVVADTRSPRGGRFIESVGFYDPLPDPARVVVDAERVREWLGRGARPSDSARHLLEREGILPRSARTPAATAASGGEGGDGVTGGAEVEGDGVTGGAASPEA